MGRDFTKLNYYEMLDVETDAGYFEIRHAYNAALQMYQSDSMVSYSFFSQEERKEILNLLEKAYLTLINEKERQKYDDELIQSGSIKVTGRRATDKKPVFIFDINRQQGKTVTLKNNTELRSRVNQNKRIGEILVQRDISGADLKTIRNELGVTIEKIARETKIRMDYIISIEENNIDRLPAAVFLKGFIKSYLKCLCIAPLDDISARYMSGLESIKKGHEIEKS